MPRLLRISLLVAFVGYLAVLLYRFVREGTFSYVMAAWQRIVFVVVVTAIGTIVVVVARRWAPLMGRTSHHPVRLLIFGIVSGGVIGLLDIGILSLLWYLHGEPDGIFRGDWDGVIVSAVLEAFFGAAAGAGFGGVLLVIESRFKRTLRFRPLAHAMLIITLASFTVTYLLLFQHGWFDSFLIIHAIVFTGCSAAAAMLATPSPPIIVSVSAGAEGQRT